jgi:hypothetical protein
MARLTLQSNRREPEKHDGGVGAAYLPVATPDLDEWYETCGTRCGDIPRVAVVRWRLPQRASAATPDAVRPATGSAVLC